MYALVTGYLQKGQDFREIEYNVVATAENLEDLNGPLCDITGWDKGTNNALDDLVSIGKDTHTYWGKDAVKESRKGALDGWGIRVRIVKLD